MQELSQFLRDANSFVASSREAIERSAPHIYISALPFANKNAAIYKMFAPSCFGLVRVDVFGLAQHGGRLVMTLKGHEGGVTSVAYSSDGLFLVSGSEHGTVHVWDTRSGEQTIPPLHIGRGHVSTVAFVPNGKSIIAGTEAGTVFIWSFMAGQSTMQQLNGHSQAVVSLATSPDGRLLASASLDRTVRLWRVVTGQLLTVLTGHDDPNNGVAISSDGQVTTARCYYPGNIELHQSEGSVRKHFRVSETTQSTVLVEGRSICVWTQQNQNEPSMIYLEGHTAPVRSTVISPNSSYVASASNDGTICVWDIEVGKESVQPSSVIILPPGLQPRLQAISRDGANIVCIFTDASARVWNAETGETRPLPLPLPLTLTLPLPLTLTLEKTIQSLTISAKGHLIAAGVEDKFWRFDALTGAEIEDPDDWDNSDRSEYDECFFGITFTSDARCIAMARCQNVPGFWSSGLPPSRLSPKDNIIEVKWKVFFVDLEAGRELSSHLPPGEDTPEYPALSVETTRLKADVDISLDRQLLAMAIETDVIYLWQIGSDLKALEPLRTAALVQSIRFSPDSTHIASGCSDNTGRIWNISTRQLVFELAGHTGSVTACIHPPDGRLIATASEDKSVRLWDAKTGVHGATLHGHRAPVELLGFTDSGSLVSCSTDGIIRVWDVSAAGSLLPEDAEEGTLALSGAKLEDGWLTGPSGKLLLWVPAEYRPYLQRPPRIFRADGDQCVIVKTGSEGWHRGQDWTSCWRGGESSAVSDGA